MEIHKTGDHRLLIEKKRFYCTDQRYKAGWETLYNQWLQRFGMGPEFEKYLTAIKKIITLRGELAEKVDAVKHLKLKEAEAQVKQMTRPKEQPDFYETLANLWETPQDPMKISVAAYYGKIQQVEKRIKAQNNNVKTDKKRI